MSHEFDSQVENCTIALAPRKCLLKTPDSFSHHEENLFPALTDSALI